MDHHTLVGRREEGKWRMGGSNQLVGSCSGGGKKDRRGPPRRPKTSPEEQSFTSQHREDLVDADVAGTGFNPDRGTAAVHLASNVVVIEGTLNDHLGIRVDAA